MKLAPQAWPPCDLCGFILISNNVRKYVMTISITITITITITIAIITTSIITSIATIINS